MIPITSEYQFTERMIATTIRDTTRYSHNIHTESPHIYWLPDV